MTKNIRELLIKIANEGSGNDTVTKMLDEPLTQNLDDNTVASVVATDNDNAVDTTGERIPTLHESTPNLGKDDTLTYLKDLTKTEVKPQTVVE